MYDYASVTKEPLKKILSTNCGKMKFLMLNAQRSGLYLYIIVIANTFIS